MRIWSLPAVLLAFAVAATPVAGQANVGPIPQRDVFVVGPDTAFGDPLMDFRPTRVDYTADPMDLSGRRELVRNLLMEQGFAHRALPLGAPGLVLHANGRLTIDSATLKQRMYKGGAAAGPGDRVMITDVSVLADRIYIDVNGGPYLPHRFLRHIQINGAPLAGDGQVGESPTGTRITLLFEGRTPRVSSAEVKALLEPLLDFGLKDAEQAYADTLPEPIRKAIAEHEVMVGMNRRMVLAALGQPESKLRERATESGSGEVFEEWIYGHTPQTIQFVRFRGNRVILLKVAALGKALQVRDHDELAAWRDPDLVHQVALGDDPGKKDTDAAPRKAPTLHLPGETVPGEVTVPTPAAGRPTGSAPAPAAGKSLMAAADTY